MNGRPFFLTTAIDYANGDPHLGHAFEKIGADVIARLHRMSGDTVHFLIGMDEHGQKVARTAAEAALSPQQFVDRVAAQFAEAWAQLDISYDEFVRTTSPAHTHAVRELIERIFTKNPNDFYEQSYTGAYCVGCEAFKTDAEIVDGRCVLHPTRTIEMVEERNWFFRLSRYRDALLAHFAAHPEFLEPESRRNEILRVLEGGLEDISASRARFTWGVPFPRPLAAGETQTTYVWFDALPNYWTVTQGANARAQWPAQLHVIGKDITRFHTIIWPAMLLAAELPLPERVWAHGFVMFGGERLSKSAGVSVELTDATNRYGADALRYYLMRDVPFDGDGSFTWDRFAEVYDSELANTLGNLASRTIAMVEKYFAGVVPDAPLDPSLAGAAGIALLVAAALPAAGPGVAGGRSTVYRFNEYIGGVMDHTRAANEFVQRKQPWALAKDPAKRDELATVLASLVHELAAIAMALAPVMPKKSQDLWRSIGGLGNVENQRWSTHPGLSVAGWHVSKSPPLFPKTETPSLSRESPTLDDSDRSTR